MMTYGSNTPGQSFVLQRKTPPPPFFSRVSLPIVLNRDDLPPPLPPLPSQPPSDCIPELVPHTAKPSTPNYKRPPRQNNIQIVFVHTSPCHELVDKYAKRGPGGTRVQFKKESIDDRRRLGKATL
uniref:Uncharacterized protein n=1 Tax=Octactis speculum TaxID=3111310 RepID=A0A7S2BRG0_9STRA